MSRPNHHEVVILGGHFAATSTAHYILRHVCPVLDKSTPNTSYHVTMVAPHTHFFWNIAAPRHLCAKNLIDTSKIMVAMSDAFKEYPPDRYSFVQGKATGIDSEKRRVNLSLVDGSSKKIDYSSLVIATGRSSNSPLWQVNDTEDETKAELGRIQEELQTARSVLIAGGGPIGVETAGEIATRHPNTRVSLYSGSDRLLPRLLIHTSNAAEKRLSDLGVQVIHGRRCVGKSTGEKSLVKFDQGPPEATDLFIDATGGRPNSAFVPSDWLNDKGFVKTDDETTRVQGRSTDGVYAVGDVASYSDGSLNGVFRAVPALGSALGTDISRRMGLNASFPTREYSAMKGTQLVPTGPNGGVGQLFGWRIPSFLVWLIKSRTFFVENAPGIVSGKSFQKP